MKAMLVAQALLLPFPWLIRRSFLLLLGHRIHRTARIGFSLIGAKRIHMGPNSRIGSLTVIRNVDEVRLDDFALLGNLNWVTGVLSTDKTRYLQHDRRSAIHIQAHAAITHRHYLDCTAQIVIGKFSTLAGVRSQVLTHSIDLRQSKQVAHPVEIADYCFVGTGSILLGPVKIGPNCVVGAGAVLKGTMDKPNCLIGGVPARVMRELAVDDFRYFHRRTGVVN
jgi:acetyltransferase-like isoleucine patch superfamily enzyme